MLLLNSPNLPAQSPDISSLAASALTILILLKLHSSSLSTLVQYKKTKKMKKNEVIYLNFKNEFYTGTGI